MISFQRMASYVGAEPFRPFRIVLAGGRTFDIRHPEMIQVARTTMTVFLYPTQDEGETGQRQVELAVLLTESVEPLEAVARPQGA